MKDVTKITAVYYLSYPNDCPRDPEDATSEVYVEVGGDNSTIDNFLYTFSFNVYTVKYVKRQFLEAGKQFLVSKAAIIVERFTDDIIKEALEEILPNIENYGIRKG